jgi:hypothetical protein
MHHMPHGGRLRHRLFEQGEGLDAPPRHRIRPAQKRSEGGEEVWDHRRLADAEGTFEQGDGLLELPLTEV